ncbi:MAG: MBL fold metallo-hydrolase [bacterium]|nr:MBL fold metallo-hydrolase [bacterium]
MRTRFHPFMPNGPAGDPALWIDVPDEGHSVLLDAGDLRRIPNRKLLRVSRVVVTHTHMDHFSGFDHLLRRALSREEELVVTGPPGFLHSMQSKLAAYSWNLIEHYPLRLVVEEVDGDRVRSVLHAAPAGLRAEPLPARPFESTIHAERGYTMRVTSLDHGIPVLGVVLDETEHLSVNKDRLLQMGLVPGPWLAELKLAARRRRPGDTRIDATAAEGEQRRFRLDRLTDELLFRTPGQKIGYFTDLRDTEENRRRVVDLAAGVDLMICEAVFLDSDRELAAERNHLTARQAGRLAREAGARRLAPFHFSPRYSDREHELMEEAAAAFGGPVIELPAGPSATET